MAGDWIKIEKTTLDKPEVLEMAAILKLDQEVVFAKLFRVWRWADSVSRDGHVKVAISSLDCIAFCPGFAEAMIHVGWLSKRGEGVVTLPNFDRHMGQSAKNRALAADRQRKKRRHDSVTPTSRTSIEKSVTREEKRREEIPETDRHARGVETGVTPEQRAKAIQAIELVVGHAMTTSENAIATTWLSSVEQQDHDIHGQSVNGVDLAARAIHAAAQAPAGPPQTVVGAIRYAKAVMSRCIENACWPGEFPEAEGVKHGNAERNRAKQAEREFAETPSAEQAPRI